MNKKKKEEGSVNSIFNEEFNKLQEDLAKREILNNELGKKVAVMEQELGKYKKLNDENYDELMRLNDENVILAGFKTEAEELITQFTKVLEEKEEENGKLREANRKMSEILGDNVGECRMGMRRESNHKLYHDMSPRGSGGNNINNNNMNTITIKHKQ